MFYQDLQSLWDKLHTDCSQESFDDLAHQLFSRYIIKRGDVEFRFLEVELAFSDYLPKVAGCSQKDKDYLK